MSQEWKIPEAAKSFDMSDAKFAVVEMSNLESKTNCFHGVISLYINSVKHQLTRMSMVVRAVRDNSTLLSLDRAHDIYDWIECEQKTFFLPVLSVLETDVVPLIGSVAVVSSESDLYVENRKQTFKDVREKLDEVIASSNAITPRLPSGERIHVFVYAYLQFEKRCLEVLHEIERIVPFRTPSRRIRSEVQKTEKYTWDYLVFNAGLSKDNKKFKLSDAQVMQGMLTDWMNNSQLKSFQKRVGIGSFRVIRRRQLKLSKQVYQASYVGGFPQNFLDTLLLEKKERSEKRSQNGMDPDIQKALSQLAENDEDEYLQPSCESTPNNLGK